LDQVFFELVAFIFFAIEAFTIIRVFVLLIFLAKESTTYSSLFVNLAPLLLLRLLVVAPQTSSLGKSIKVFKFVSTFCFIVTKTNKSFRKSRFFLISHFQGFSGETNLWYAFNASLISEVGTWSFWSGDVISPNGDVSSRLLSRYLMLPTNILIV